MIKIRYLKNDDVISMIEIEGHANYDEEGKDIVCSAVSAIFVGGCNALINEDSFDITLEKGYSKVEVIDEIDEHDEIVLDTMIIQLFTIAKSYPNYVRISEQNERNGK